MGASCSDRLISDPSSSNPARVVLWCLLFKFEITGSTFWDLALWKEIPVFLNRHVYRARSTDCPGGMKPQKKSHRWLQLQLQVGWVVSTLLSATKLPTNREVQYSKCYFKPPKTHLIPCNLTIYFSQVRIQKLRAHYHWVITKCSPISEKDNFTAELFWCWDPGKGCCKDSWRHRFKRLSRMIQQFGIENEVFPQMHSIIFHLCPVYAQSMPSLCPVYAQSMPPYVCSFAMKFGPHRTPA